MGLRTRRGLSLGASVLLIVAACTPAAESPAPTDGTPPATTAATATPAEGSASPAPSVALTPPGSQPPTGTTLVYALDGEVTQMNNAAADYATTQAIEWMYNALYRYDDALTPIPDLAAELAEVSEDGLTWTIQLIDNAVFQPTGTSLSADDVVFTYQLAASKNCRFNPSVCLSSVLIDHDEDPSTPTVPAMTSVSKVDDLTVQFQLAAPYAPFVTMILPSIQIDSKEAVEAAFAEFQAQAGNVPDAQINDLQARIRADATLPDGEPNPEANPAQFRAELETLLDAVGVKPDPAGFPETDDQGEPTGAVDEASYVGALVAALDDLAASRQEAGIDAIAAAYPLLATATRQPVGTGPFTVTRFVPGQRIELVRNEQYHFGVPQIEQLFMPIIKSDVAGAEAVAAGSVDWKYSLFGQALGAVKDAPNVKIAEYVDFGYFGVQFNLREGQLFADRNLRYALAHCIQKEEIVQAATNGEGVPVYGTIPPASWAYNTDLPRFEFNVELGKSLIEQSGWTLDGTSTWRGDGTTVYEKDGKTLGTNILVRADSPDRISFMRLLVDQANQNCGFDMTIEQVDFTVLNAMIFNYPHTQPGLNRPFDAYFGGWQTSYDPDPYSTWHSSQCTNADLPDAYNYICYQNADADALIEQGLRELDQQTRAEIYQQFEAIVAEDMPYLFAWSPIGRQPLNVELNYSDEEWTPDLMQTPTWFYQYEKVTKTSAW